MKKLAGWILLLFPLLCWAICLVIRFGLETTLISSVIVVFGIACVWLGVTLIMD